MHMISELDGPSQGKCFRDLAFTLFVSGDARLTLNHFNALNDGALEAIYSNFPLHVHYYSEIKAPTTHFRN